MSSDVKEYMQAYKLVRCYDPYKEKRRYGEHKEGLCYLKLLREEENVEEIYADIPPRRIFYEDTGLVKPFCIDNYYDFESLHVSIGSVLCSFQLEGTVRKENQYAFHVIYESHENEIILLINSWYAQQITRMSLTLRDKRISWPSNWRSYEVQFVDDRK